MGMARTRKQNWGLTNKTGETGLPAELQIRITDRNLEGTIARVTLQPYAILDAVPCDFAGIHVSCQRVQRHPLDTPRATGECAGDFPQILLEIAGAKLHLDPLSR